MVIFISALCSNTVGDMKRLILIALSLAIAAIIVCLWYGFKVEPKQLKLRKVTIESPHWTGEPIMIGLLGDLLSCLRGIT